MLVQCDKTERSAIARLMMSTIIPRPIAWVLSDNGNASFNLAPFSYFNAITSDPPLLSISIGHKKTGDKKDTWRNIEERSHFVVNVPSFDFAEQVTATSAPLAHGMSEISENAMRLVEVAGWRLPRVDGINVAYLCCLHQIVEVGNGPQGLVIGQVEAIYVDDRVLVGGIVSAEKLNPLARLGGSDYAGLGEVARVSL